MSVPKKWMQLVGGQGDSVLSTEGALSGATAVKLPSWSQSLEKQAPQSPGRLFTVGGEASFYRCYYELDINICLLISAQSKNIMAVAILFLPPPPPPPKLAGQACLLERVVSADTWVTVRSGRASPWLEELPLMGLERIHKCRVPSLSSSSWPAWTWELWAAARVFGLEAPFCVFFA